MPISPQCPQTVFIPRTPPLEPPSRSYRHKGPDSFRGVSGPSSAVISIRCGGGGSAIGAVVVGVAGVPIPSNDEPCSGRAGCGENTRSCDVEAAGPLPGVLKICSLLCGSFSSSRNLSCSDSARALSRSGSGCWLLVSTPTRVFPRARVFVSFASSGPEELSSSAQFAGTSSTSASRSATARQLGHWNCG